MQKIIYLQCFLTAPPYFDNKPALKVIDEGVKSRRDGDTSERDVRGKKGENEGDGETDMSAASPPVRRDTEAVTPGPPILQTHGATLGRSVSARVCGQGG